jgi:hypothetical protein
MSSTPSLTRRGDSGEQLGPLVLLPTFYLDVLPHWRGPLQEIDHRCSLRLEAEPGTALLLGRNAVVGEVGGHGVKRAV